MLVSKVVFVSEFFKRESFHQHSFFGGRLLTGGKFWTLRHFKKPFFWLNFVIAFFRSKKYHASHFLWKLLKAETKAFPFCGTESKVLSKGGGNQATLNLLNCHKRLYRVGGVGIARSLSTPNQPGFESWLWRLLS